jgi:hypothetical protein
VSWQDYKLFYDKRRQPPNGSLSAWVRGPRGGAQFVGYFTPDELDQLALEAARAAERERIEQEG